MMTPNTIREVPEHREAVAKVLRDLHDGRYEVRAEHCSGGAPGAGDDWPDPADMAVDCLPGNADMVASITDIRTDCINLTVAAIDAVEVAIHALIYAECEIDHPGVPMRAIDDLAISITDK